MPVIAVLFWPELTYKCTPHANFVQPRKMSDKGAMLVASNSSSLSTRRPLCIKAVDMLSQICLASLDGFRGRLKSILMVRCLFLPYKGPQLVDIVHSYLSGGKFIKSLKITASTSRPSQIQAVSRPTSKSRKALVCAHSAALKYFVK
jgi:hypothetical protein